MTERPDEPEDLETPPSFFPQSEFGGIGHEEHDFGDPVSVSVEGVYYQPGGGPGEILRFVMLTDGSRRLRIMIGEPEADSIVISLEGKKLGRPMTHDLFAGVLEKLDIRLVRVVIDDLWAETYYAKLILQDGSDEEVVVDSRPSDAIALAIRTSAPIFVSEGILNLPSR